MFEPSDPWLLLSIIMAAGEKGAALRSIISTGDYINKAIFKDWELHSGFCRLTEAGYIHEKAGEFFPDKGKLKSFYVYFKDHHNTGKLLDMLTEQLGAKKYAFGYNAVKASEGFQYPGLTDEMIATAIKEYLDNF